jgi:hypothetical protein
MAHDTIEIYVRNLSTDEATDWLRTVLDDLTPVNDAIISTVEGTHDDARVPVQIAEGVEDGPYTSLWFNAPTTPWDSAAACAREAYDGLQKEVLCFLNDPEKPWKMLRVSEEGEEYVDKREKEL